jgi:hypothetical protein
MKNIIKWVQGFVAGITTTLFYVREIQEVWQSRVLNGRETYTSFWSWQKGYGVGYNLRRKF